MIIKSNTLRTQWLETLNQASRSTSNKRLSQSEKDDDEEDCTGGHHGRDTAASGRRCFFLRGRFFLGRCFLLRRCFFLGRCFFFGDILILLLGFWVLGSHGGGPTALGLPH